MNAGRSEHQERPRGFDVAQRLRRRFSAVAPGWWLVLSALGITTILWVLGRSAAPAPAQFRYWLEPSLLISAWSITLLALLLLANTRSRKIEPFFGGLDRAVRLHRQLGPITVGLVLVHVVLYIPPQLGFGGSLADLIIPFHSPRGAEGFNALILWLVVGWTVLAYTKGFRYERWLSLHGVFGPIFILTSAHALMLGPTINAYEPLRFWMWLLVLLGTGAWLYRVVLYRWFAPRFRYSVQRVDQTSENTVDLVMRPKSRRMLYEPGTFIFINRPDRDRRELHPFSISSSPAERDLRVSVQMVGDFTRDLLSLQPGDPIEVFGPFGGFTPHRYAGYRRLICVGSGIGITPFLSILRFEAINNDFRRIWLYYIAKDATRAPYDAEIRDAVPKADSFIDYELWQTAERGRPTAKTLLEATQPLDGVAVMLCGRPEFVREMARQFQEAGIPAERIIAEDFHFH